MHPGSYQARHGSSQRRSWSRKRAADSPAAPLPPPRMATSTSSPSGGGLTSQWARTWDGGSGMASQWARTWARTTLGFARLLRGGRGKARRARGAPECACVTKFLHVRACTVHEYVCTSKTRANAWIWCLKSCTYSTVRVPADGARRSAESEGSVSD